MWAWGPHPAPTAMGRACLLAARPRRGAHQYDSYSKASEVRNAQPLTLPSVEFGDGAVPPVTCTASVSPALNVPAARKPGASLQRLARCAARASGKDAFPVRKLRAHSHHMLLRWLCLRVQGKRHSEETRARIGEARRGTRLSFSEATSAWPCRDACGCGAAALASCPG